MTEENLANSCECKCHFGGAISCPGCKKNHEIENCCNHCN